MKSRFVAAWDWEGKVWGEVGAEWPRGRAGFFPGEWKCSKAEGGEGSTTLTTPKANELHTLNSRVV